MSGDGDARRARLGDAAVAAAHREAREAPAPTPATFDALAVLFAGLRRYHAERLTPRDDVA